MRFTVDPWSVEYGASVESDLRATEVEVDPAVERPVEEWGPVGPAPEARPAATVLFVDGVRRVDARVWIEGPDADVQPGVCASYAAGVVCCTTGERAELAHASVARGVFSASPHAARIETRHGAYEPYPARAASPEALWLALQDRMAHLEVEAAEVARAGVADGAALVAVDGPLRGRGHVPGAVGVVKSHGVAYLPPGLHRVIGRLAAGERSPLFTVGGRWARYSWYLRLPGGTDAPWAGVVRVECAADLEPADAVALAEVVSVTLPRYASEPYKDARAPQNLVPVGGLERELRRRLGDPALLYRGLRVAATAGS